ncbi:MAG TPA: hypothetical protein VNZ57_02065 [Longimicrobiales bacterium]|nr:hypothetical protein [Longimicrobiales bacterium]
MSSREWTGPLATLLPTLRREALRLAAQDPGKGPNPWAWYLLARGALVAVRIVQDMRSEVRFARPQRPATEDGLRRWENEVGVFMAAVGIEEEPGKWYRVPGEDPESEARGGIGVRWIELRPGEVEPGWALCWDCRQEGRTTRVVWFAGGGEEGQACLEHAAEHGRRVAHV